MNNFSKNPADVLKDLYEEGDFEAIRETYKKMHSLCEELVDFTPPATTDLQRLAEILDGIDKDETEYAGGWWETSTGAAFGAKKKAEIVACFMTLAQSHKDIIAKVKAYLEPQSNDAQSQRVHDELMAAIAEGDRL